jgi:hypothetical protein
VASTGVLVLFLYSWELSPPVWCGDEDIFAAENWALVGKLAARFEKHHWAAKMAAIPFGLIAWLVKAFLNYLLIPGALPFYYMAVYNVLVWSQYIPHIS